MGVFFHYCFQNVSALKEKKKSGYLEFFEIITCNYTLLYNMKGNNVLEPMRE